MVNRLNETIISSLLNAEEQNYTTIMKQKEGKINKMQLNTHTQSQQWTPSHIQLNGFARMFVYKKNGRDNAQK